MGERVPDSLTPDLILTGEDSLENARKAREVIMKKFPKVGFRIISDPVDIGSITPKSVRSGDVLIQIIIPEGERVDTVNLMKTWADSLRQ
jgi:hypothetical protein